MLAGGQRPLRLVLVSSRSVRGVLLDVQPRQILQERFSLLGFVGDEQFGRLAEDFEPDSASGIEAVAGGWSQHDAGWNRNDFGVFRSPDADYDTLVEVILRAIEPDSWEENGGDGSILPFEPTMLLMVAQRADVHARIERLLVRLRQVRGLNR